MTDAPDSTLPVTIALCTYNGGRYLEEQLASFAAQDHENWVLWVSDDGSTDDTRALLETYRKRWQGRHEVHIVEGPARGSAGNFLSLLCHPDLPEGFVALSDQDDVWHPGKLSRALGELCTEGSGEPALYGAQYLIADADLRPFAMSSRPAKTPGFRNALLQNVVSGQSTVLNSEALSLVRQAGSDHRVEFHDWWLYQLVSGAGGRVLIDDEVVLTYRQHEGNVLGTNHGRQASVARLKLLFGGRFGRWVDANLAALTCCAHLLTAENREIVEQLKPHIGKRGIARARAMRRVGLRRQKGLDNLLLYLAAICGRS